MANYTNRPVYGYTFYGTESFINGIYYKSNPTRGVIMYESKTGSPVANWKQKVKDLQDASSGYFRQWGKFDEEGYFDVTVKKLASRDWTRAYGYTSALPVWSGGWSYDDAVTRDIAVTKIKRKIASDKGDFAVYTNLLQDVYEFRRTITGSMDSLVNLSQNMGKLLGSRRTGGKAGLVRNLAELYLQWTFGINPTLRDAKELAESIQKYLDRNDHVKRFQASHYFDTNKSQVSTIQPINGMTLKISEVFSRRYSCKYTSGHNMTLASGNNYGLYDHFHLAPSDFIPTLWELLPWTWVWDYMFTIGPFLTDTFQSNTDFSFYDVSSITEQRYFKAHIDVIPGAGWAVTNKVIRPRALSYGKFTRTPLAHLPGRMLRLRTEYEMGTNVWNKLMNLLAVLVTKQNRLILR